MDVSLEDIREITNEKDELYFKDDALFRRMTDDQKLLNLRRRLTLGEKRLAPSKVKKTCLLYKSC